MGLTVTSLSRFRAAAGVYVRYNQRTLRELADAADSSDMALTRGSYRLRPPGGRRREPDLRVTLRLSMPVWGRLRSASDEEREEWNRFYAALLEHEEGHFQRFADAAQEIYDALEGMDPGSMTREADRRWRAMMNDQRSYDRATGHGTRQRTAHGSTVIRPP